MKIKTHKARADRYIFGSKKLSKNGKERKDYYTPNPAGDSILVRKGETYWSWKFKNSPKRFSAVRPTERQLCKSDFLIALMDLVDEIETGLSSYDVDEATSTVESAKESMEELLSELEEKVSNMEQFQGLSNSPNCELLRERVQLVQGIIDELSSCEFDEDDESTFDDAKEAIVSATQG